MADGSLILLVLSVLIAILSLILMLLHRMPWGHGLQSFKYYFELDVTRSGNVKLVGQQDLSRFWCQLSCVVWGKFIVKILCASLSTCDYCLALVGDSVLIRDALIMYENIYYVWKSLTLDLLLSSSMGKRNGAHNQYPPCKAHAKSNDQSIWKYFSSGLGLRGWNIRRLMSRFIYKLRFSILLCIKRS